MSYPLSMSLGAEARGETGKWYQRDAVATLNGTWSFRPVLPATYRRVPAHKGGNATFMANEGTKEQRMCNFKDFNTSALSQTKWRDITKGHDWTEFSKGMLAMQKQKIAKDFDSLSKVIRQRVNNGRLLNANVEIYKERLYYELRYEYTERFVSSNSDGDADFLQRRCSPGDLQCFFIRVRLARGSRVSEHFPENFDSELMQPIEAARDQ